MDNNCPLRDVFIFELNLSFAFVVEFSSLSLTVIVSFRTECLTWFEIK